MAVVAAEYASMRDYVLSTVFGFPAFPAGEGGKRTNNRASRTVWEGVGGG